MKWQDVSVDIKTLSPMGWPCSRVIYMYKIIKKIYIWNQTSMRGFDTFNNWPKWQHVPIDIDISSPRGVVSLSTEVIYEKMGIKSDIKKICFKLVANDRRDKRFLLTSKLCPLGNVCPWPAAKSWKDVYKVRGWREFFKLETNDRSDEAFLWTSKLWP